ncbi:MAG: CoA transferase [Deltaproteobacteria bacterium]|nr:CoA transferase [Deltaproteobacteria bacterium]MBW1815534.1 CoA transferase [Deltaproteobacteria bacterium]
MLLDSYRVLDLSNHRGQFCGKILGDLGADILKIEPPGGDKARSFGPFIGDDPHPEKSLYWIAHNTNKRGITLDIGTGRGKALLLDMVKGAKFLIESHLPERSDELGLSFEALSDVNPSLIMVSITPFGRTGPYRHFKDSELVNMSLGGQMVLCGDPDRPPLGFPVEQSYCLAGMNAAVAALAAHLHRERTGEGQHVDVSIQESVLLTTFNLHEFWELQGVHLKRQGACAMRGSLTFRTCWACKDGYVSWRIFSGHWGRWTRSFVEWMDREDMAGELAEFPWEDVDMNALSQEELNRFEAVFADFFLQHTKGEIYEQARSSGIPFFPVNTPADVLKDAQLAGRDFWREVPGPESGTVLKHPGPAIQPFGEAAPLARAPRIGEHNADIYMGELGLTGVDLMSLKKAGVV